MDPNQNPLKPNQKMVPLNTENFLALSVYASKLYF
jgi:hypothetical protein